MEIKIFANETTYSMAKEDEYKKYLLFRYKYYFWTCTEFLRNDKTRKVLIKSLGELFTGNCADK